MQLLAGDKLVSEGTVVSTFHQYAGRGQMGNTWECPPDVNIAMSIILQPKFIKPTQQFLLNCIAALAVRDALAQYTEKQVSVKWPNDVLIENKKVCGILIQNTLSSTQVLTSVIGIGINVNQDFFGEHLPHASSLRLETGEINDLKTIQTKCFTFLERYYLSLRQGSIKRVETAYRAQLYAYKEARQYKLPNGELFEATSLGVNEIGQLRLLSDGVEKHYGLKEVSLVM